MAHKNIETSKSLIGQYGPWASGLLPETPHLSYRHSKYKKIKKWRKKAAAKVEACMAPPELGGLPEVQVHKRYEYDNLQIEEISYQLPYGRPTEAVVLKPLAAKGPLPGILGLHDHSGNKYLGKRKIIRTTDNMPVFVKELQENYHEDRAWANELAKRGYVVMVHDTFTFGSRRVQYQDVDGVTWGPLWHEEQPAEPLEDPIKVAEYNKWASAHEHVMAKSLLSAGTSWPGVFFREDQKALDILCSRPDVDAKNIGCAGLSGGGLRTAYLGGLDKRIKAAVCVGFMTTWKDLILHKSFTHTWMTYIPLLSRYLDFPDVFSLRVPLPTMVLNNKEDQLFSLSEMQRADRILQEVFKKAEASEKYKCNFYEGPHKFDIQMQEDAFNWLDTWLSGK